MVYRNHLHVERIGGSLEEQSSRGEKRNRERGAMKIAKKKKKRKMLLAALLVGIISCAGLFATGFSAAVDPSSGGEKDSTFHETEEDQQAIGLPAIRLSQNAEEVTIGFAEGEVEEFVEDHAVPMNDWNMILINRKNPLPSDFSPDLSYVEGRLFDSRAADALQNMMNEARAEGLSPLICSSYRTVEEQTVLYQNQIQQQQNNGYSPEEAERVAGTIVAYPGTSEHHSGLAVDIVATSNQMLIDGQEHTAESMWLHANCHRFGFVLRYPKDKQEVTGIIYEPWHYRYVGVEAATEMMESGLCLEEYLNH